MIDFFKLQKNQAVETTSPHNANMSRPLNHRANLNFSTKRVVTNLVALALVGVGISPISASAAQEDLIVSVANPGVQSYADSGLSADADVLVESFDNAQWTWVCTQSYWDEWGEQCQAGEDRFDSPVGLFTTTFGYFFPADRWGGAGGTGQYAAAGEILLTISDQSDYRYLGFWWSAGSIGNDVQLLDADDNVLATFTVDNTDPNSEEDLLGVTADDAYTHNPNHNVCDQYSGWPNCWETWEKYAFVHLRYPPGFRKVRFVSSGNGFEFDNVTISTEVPDFADSETTTETFTPYALSTSALILADPRTGEVSFPGVSLDAGAGEANAMLCIAEVADQSGTALTGSPTFQITDSGSTLTAGGDNSLRTFSGTRTNVESLSSGLVLTPGNFSQSFGVVGSRYIRVTATPQSNAGTAGCTGNAIDSEIVEVRFVNMIQRNSFGIQID